VKRIQLLAVVAIALSLIATGCGTSDYVQSIQLTTNGASSGGFFNLSGIDGTLQLTVLAIYHSGKNVPVTDSVTYTVTATGYQAGTTANPLGPPLPAFDSTPAPVTINTTGMMTATSGLCTWLDIGTPIPTPPQFNWEYTGYYSVVATYNGMQSQPVAIGVGSAASETAPNGQCGPD
jgi:hypothetical protein